MSAMLPIAARKQTSREVRKVKQTYAVQQRKLTEFSNPCRCWESGRDCRRLDGPPAAGGTACDPLELVAAQSGHLECQICPRHPATVDRARVVQPTATWIHSAILSWRRSLQLDCWRLLARDKKRLVH